VLADRRARGYFGNRPPCAACCVASTRAAAEVACTRRAACTSTVLVQASRRPRRLMSRQAACGPKLCRRRGHACRACTPAAPRSGSRQPQSSHTGQYDPPVAARCLARMTCTAWRQPDPGRCHTRRSPRSTVVCRAFGHAVAPAPDPHFGQGEDGYNIWLRRQVITWL
jgi:hypothetical protein